MSAPRQVPRLRRRFSPFGRAPGNGLIALLLAIAAFGLYATTTGQLAGYEPETAAVAEGLVKTGELRLLPGTPLSQEGLPGRDGRRYSRTGLAQPLLEAPFYFVGERLDEETSSGHGYKWRLALLRLFNPVMAVLTVLALFGLLLLRGRSSRAALVVAGLAAIGSLIWPYAKIGMDTTLMASLALSLVAAAWAASRGGTVRYALAGIAAMVAIATKPYGFLLLLGVIPLLIAPLRRFAPGIRARALCAYIIPVLVGLASIAWYNAYRTGSLTNFLHPNPTDIGHLPLNALGLVLSPGKGLLLYSPLVVLGLLGLRPMWRSDRPFALAILLTAAINIVIIAATWVWSDDTWGPRYIVPSAWLLLAPIAWWAVDRHRRRALAWVAALAILVQGVGIFAREDFSTIATRRLTGVFVYPIEVTTPLAPIPYGNDGPRWVPSLSPLLLQSEVLAAWFKEQLTGSGFVLSYNPTWGSSGRFDLRHPGSAVGMVFPDFWWRFPGLTPALAALAALLGLTGLGAGGALVRFTRHPSFDRASEHSA